MLSFINPITTTRHGYQQNIQGALIYLVACPFMCLNNLIASLKYRNNSNAIYNTFSIIRDQSSVKCVPTCTLHSLSIWCVIAFIDSSCPKMGIETLRNLIGNKLLPSDRWEYLLPGWHGDTISLSELFNEFINDMLIHLEQTCNSTLGS